MAERDAVGQKLQNTKDKLAENYVQKQKMLYSSLLPEVWLFDNKAQITCIEFVSCCMLYV